MGPGPPTQQGRRKRKRILLPCSGIDPSLSLMTIPCLVTPKPRHRLNHIELVGAVSNTNISLFPSILGIDPFLSIIYYTHRASLTSSTHTILHLLIPIKDILPSIQISQHPSCPPTTTHPLLLAVTLLVLAGFPSAPPDPLLLWRKTSCQLNPVRLLAALSTVAQSRHLLSI